MSGLVLIETDNGAVCQLDFPTGPAFSFDIKLMPLQYLAFIEAKLVAQGKKDYATFVMNVMHKLRNKKNTGIRKINLEIGYLYTTQNVEIHSFSGSERLPFGNISPEPLSKRNVSSKKSRDGDSRHTVSNP